MIEDIKKGQSHELEKMDSQERLKRLQLLLKEARLLQIETKELISNQNEDTAEEDLDKLLNF